MSLFQELQRRNVIRVAMAYVVAAWLIIQVVETTFPYFGFSDNAIRIVFILLGIGIAPAVIGAWVFQFTPDGLKLDKDGRHAAEESRDGLHKFDRAIIVVLVLGISYFAFDKFVLAPERSAEREAEVAAAATAKALTGYYGDRSIAVLPFVNMSSDPEQEFFGDGIAEEVLNLLARIRELRVISRSSAFAFKGQNLEITDIAQRLDVGHILEGSVRLSGKRVRVTAQLIEARTDTHLWSDTYDGDLEDVFALQDKIAADVVQNLKIELLSPLPKSRAIDPEVFALTQQAKVIFGQRPDGTGRKMHALLQRALEIDSDYVPAMVWMGNAHYFRREEGIISQEEYLRSWEELETRILELEPDNVAVVVFDAWDAAAAGNFEEAARLFDRGISRDASDSDLVRLAGVFARMMGKFDTSIRLAEHAVAIDPLCFQCLYQLSRAHLYAGNLLEAAEARRRYMAIGSGGHYHMGLMLLLQGKAQEALEHYQEEPSERHDRIAGRSMAYYDLGEIDNAEAELADLLLAKGHEDIFLMIAEVYAWMGRKDLAFKWLNTSVSRDLRPDQYRAFNPAFRNLRDDPRWDEWLETLGLSAGRLDAIEFNPDLPE